MNRYVIFIAYDDALDWGSADEQTRAYYVAAHAAFSEYVAAHGRELGSAALDDQSAATTLRRTGAAESVSDGPFAETTEQIGGYYDVELPDLDHAVAAARLLPRAYTLEIRPTVRVGT